MTKRFISLLLLVAFAAAVFGGVPARSSSPQATPDEAVTAETPDVGAPATPAPSEPTPAPCPTPTPAGEPAAHTSNATPTDYAPDRLHGTAAQGLPNDNDNHAHTATALNRGRRHGSGLRC